MKSVIAFVIGTVVVAAAPSFAEPSSPSPSTSLQRIALLLSADDGGFGRPRLRWSGDDARAMGAVLGELGGIDDKDIVHVEANDAADVETALARLDGDVAAAHARGARVELIVYYSGHSDIDGLLLGNDRLPWSTLRARVAEMNADVRVVILDSCSSGALVRLKGGRHLPPFATSDGAVRGHAFLTSSRDDEPSQESDRVRGSFFTHALITGLRGAADATGDGLVTLNEAYQFAFQETLARTELAAGGAQHPAYDIQLAGSGEWVVTDLRDSSAGLVLGADVVGRVLLRDARGRLVAELQKGATEIVLGVPAGSYEVRVLQPGKAFSTTISVGSGARATLTAAMLTENAVLATTARGAADADGIVNTDAFVFANVSLITPLESNVVVGRPVHNAFGLHLIVGSQHRLTGFNLAGGLNITTGTVEGVEVGGAGNVIVEDARAILIGGATNVVATRLQGIGIAGGANVVGSADGLLLAGGANVAAVDGRALAIAGGANVVGDHWLGGQLAGAFNFATRGFTGAQITGGVNVGGIDSLGLALGSVNLHERLRGAQLAVVNIGGDVVGAQVGVINIANTVSGAQVGVVNVAASSEVSVGLLSLIGDGIHHVGVQGNELFPAAVVARLGSRRVYGVFEAGWSPYLETGHQILTLRAGPGVRFPFMLGEQPLSVDVEAVGGNLHRADDLLVEGLHLATTARALVRWQALPMLSVYAGPAVNVLIVDKERTFNVPLAVVHFKSGVDTIVAPGLTIGIEL